jgi:hypothetical protein
MGFIDHQQGNQTTAHPYSIADQRQNVKDRIEEYKRQAGTFDLSPDEKALVLAHREAKAKRIEAIVDVIVQGTGIKTCIARQVYDALFHQGYLKE